MVPALCSVWDGGLATFSTQKRAEGVRTPIRGALGEAEWAGAGVSPSRLSLDQRCRGGLARQACLDPPTEVVAGRALPKVSR